MRTRQWLQAAIVTFLGLFFLDVLLSGRIAFYINETRFIWLSWLATGILLIMGVVQIYGLMITNAPPKSTDKSPAKSDVIAIDDKFGHTPGGSAHDHAGHAHDGGSQHAPGWGVLIVVAIPLIVALLIPAQPLGAAAAQNSGVSASFTGGNAVDVLSIAPQDRNVLDWIRVFNSSKNYGEFDGQSADFIGFVYRDITLNEASNFMVARFTISCCVADASALGVLVESKDAARLEQDTWVRVKGKFQAQTIKEQRTPVLIAESIEPIARPKTPYLYP